MTVTAKDGLYTFGTLETVEIPSAGPGSANDSIKKAPLGVLYRHKGNMYRYALFHRGSIAAAANKVAYWHELDPVNSLFEVTADVSEAIDTAGANMCAGILGCVVTDGYYTWVQVGGVTDAVCVAAVTVGDKLIYGGDGAFARIAHGANNTDVVFAIALETVDPTSFVGSVLLQNMDW